MKVTRFTYVWVFYAIMTLITAEVAYTIESYASNMEFLLSNEITGPNLYHVFLISWPLLLGTIANMIADYANVKWKRLGWMIMLLPLILFIFNLWIIRS